MGILALLGYSLLLAILTRRFLLSVIHSRRPAFEDVFVLQPLIGRGLCSASLKIVKLHHHYMQLFC